MFDKATNEKAQEDFEKQFLRDLNRRPVILKTSNETTILKTSEEWQSFLSTHNSIIKTHSDLKNHIMALINQGKEGSTITNFNKTVPKKEITSPVNANCETQLVVDLTNTANPKLISIDVGSYMSFTNFLKWTVDQSNKKQGNDTSNIEDTRTLFLMHKEYNFNPNNQLETSIKFFTRSNATNDNDKLDLVPNENIYDKLTEEEDARKKAQEYLKNRLSTYYFDDPAELYIQSMQILADTEDKRNILDKEAKLFSATLARKLAGVDNNTSVNFEFLEDGNKFLDDFVKGIEDEQKNSLLDLLKSNNKEIQKTLSEMYFAENDKDKKNKISAAYNKLMGIGGKFFLVMKIFLLLKM